MGISTGAGAIFGVTGGVIEAATRTIAEWVTGESLGKVDFRQLRGMEGIREAYIEVDDTKLHLGIVHGLGNVQKLMDLIKAGKVEQFHAIEVMACPGGCIGGGGQPYHHGNMEIIRKRAEGLYEIDRDKPIRKSHENPAILELYEQYLQKPLGEKSHHLLHTKYFSRHRI
jgi:NADP-reducing hydrogenase subunit HndD